MKKIIIYTILVSFILPFYAFGQIKICSTCQIKSLSQAIQEAKKFDTIVIEKGIYKAHNILIDKPLTIIGKNNPIIDGELKGEIIKIVADNVTIDGLTIKNVGTSYTKDFAAIRVTKSNHFVIKNLRLENLYFGIYLEKSNYGKVLNNTIIGVAKEEYNSGNGIQLWNSNHILVENNKITGVRDGIYFEFANNCIVRKNYSYKNLRYGLHFMFSNDDSYQQNTFQNNGAGVAVMFSKRIKMIANTFKENWGSASYGLLLKEIDDATISKNMFYKNSIAINIEGGNRVTYLNNTFSNNGWALKVRGACYKNSFVKNNFLYNSFDISYNSKINDNYFKNNYWSDYTGYDLDRDGVGDVPYRPVKLFSYIVNNTPETLILMRSLFIDIINFSEKVSPVFTPDNLIDNAPLMKKI